MHLSASARLSVLSSICPSIRLSLFFLKTAVALGFKRGYVMRQDAKMVAQKPRETDEMADSNSKCALIRDFGHLLL